MEREKEFAIKIAFEGRIKRLRMLYDYETLCLTIRDSFVELKDSSFSLHYVDNELDTIEIENEGDFVLAIKSGQEMDNLLKIYIEKRGKRYYDSNSIQTCIQTSFLCESSCIHLRHDTYFAYRCEVCLRVFACRRSFDIHANVCDQVFKKKRTPFDSRLMRMRGIAWDNDIALLYLNSLFDMKKNYSGYVKAKREECFMCNRLFAQNSFPVHLKGCKNIMCKRTPFVSKKQRTNGHLEIVVRKSSVLYNKHNESNKSGVMSDWKKDSLRFRNILKIKRLLQKRSI